MSKYAYMHNVITLKIATKQGIVVGRQNALVALAIIRVGHGKTMYYFILKGVSYNERESYQPHD